MMTLLRAAATGLAAISLALHAARPVDAQSAPLGGFIPLVGIGLTDEFDDGEGLNATFFVAQAEDSYVGSPLHGVGQPAYFDLALLDTGAATHILTSQASGNNGFRINGNGFDGSNTQQIGGATGLITLSINDPLAIFAAGLADRTSAGTALVMDTGAMRGQSSVATLSAPTQWKLPNILGLPMAAQHAIVIRNDEPQIFQHQGRTVRTPNIDFVPLGTGAQQGIARRTDLILRPGTGFISGPLYVQSLDGILSGQPFSENPQSPTVVENGALFLPVDMTNGARTIQDKEFLFDTGADLTVISQVTAARLGIDAVLDEPDFLLEVEGSGGVSQGVPGYYIEELNLDTVGGSFTLHNVPVAVLDVTNPNNPGNTIDGIIGTHLFTGRNLVIDANPSIGQGGAGPSLYVSDPVYQTHTWASTATTAPWSSASSWSASGTPTILWDAQVRNTGLVQQATVDGNSTVYRLTVGGSDAGAIAVAVPAGVTLTTFGETLIDSGGKIALQGGKLEGQFVNIDGGSLAGSGEVFVGAGPIQGAVRNLAGTVAPEGIAGISGPIGTLSITGDLANLADGVLQFDVAGLAAGQQHDQLALSRSAYLDGKLEVRLANLGGGTFTPSVGQSFTLITAAGGVFGAFSQLDLPTGFTWNVAYQPNAVVLQVLGLGTLAGDFNQSGAVNAADEAAWRAGFSTTYDGADVLVWQRHLVVGGTAAAVPEPTGVGCLLVATLPVLPGRRRLASA